jgi:hypothetical protein
MREFLDQLGNHCEMPTAFSLDESKLDELSDIIQVISAKAGGPFNWRNNDYWPENSATRQTVSQFFTVGNAINFRYWTLSNRRDLDYCQSTKGGIPCRGAKYMWRCLKINSENGDYGLLEAGNLARMTKEEVASIFRDDSGKDVMPHLEERLRNWNDLGSTLQLDWGGSSYNMIRGCEGSLLNFVERHRTFRAFDDPLFKMTMVNAIMHQGRGLVRFSDEIFPGVDYQLARQMLRQGVVVPPRNISRKVMNQELLTQAEGLFLRQATLCAFVKLGERSLVSGEIIDNVFWQNREICKDDDPLCLQCAFACTCTKDTRFRIPLEETRYY